MCYEEKFEEVRSVLVSVMEKLKDMSRNDRAIEANERLRCLRGRKFGKH